MSDEASMGSRKEQGRVGESEEGGRGNDKRGSTNATNVRQREWRRRVQIRDRWEGRQMEEMRTGREVKVWGGD